MSNRIKTLLPFIFVLPLSLYGDLVAEYLFNEPAGSTHGDDSAGMGAQNLILSGGAQVGANGSGVGGGPANRAFDNTASTGMGTGFTGGVGSSSSDDNILDGLTTFTLSGWIKAETTIADGARILDDSGGGMGFILTGRNPGQLKLEVNAASQNSDSGYSNLNQWYFFAVTYDGTLTSTNVNWYRGDELNPASLVNGPDTLNQGAAGENTAMFRLGNNGNGNRPWDGYLDNIRIHNTVLNESEIEDLRAADVIPEPGSGMLILLSVLVLQGIRIFREPAGRM